MWRLRQSYWPSNLSNNCMDVTVPFYPLPPAPSCLLHSNPPRFLHSAGLVTVTITSCVQYSLSHPQILFSLYPTTSPMPYYTITPFTLDICGRESFSLTQLTAFLWYTRSRSLALFYWSDYSTSPPCCCCSSDSYSLYVLVSFTASHWIVFHINNLWVRTFYSVLDSHSVLAPFLSLSQTAYSKHFMKSKHTISLEMHLEKPLN